MSSHFTRWLPSVDLVYFVARFGPFCGEDWYPFNGENWYTLSYHLQIPTLDVNVKIYEGTDSKTLAKGAGHFPDTSIWNGNVAIAGHNRGSNCYFGSIHTLKLGDTITLTTKLGTRTYEVTSVSKVSETDRSGLAASNINMLTLYTCVQNQSAYRWCVKAVEVV